MQRVAGEHLLRADLAWQDLLGRRELDHGLYGLTIARQASAMGHHFGSELISRYWTEACNDLIARIARLRPDKISPVCQLPQSPGVSPKHWVEELERCVKEQGFVACNINPDVAGGGEPFTPSLGDAWWRGHPIPMEPASRHACAGGP